MGTRAKKRAPRSEKEQPKEGAPDKTMIDQMVAQERKDRETACNTEIQAALEKHQCVMIGQTIIRGNSVSQGVVVTAR